MAEDASCPCCRLQSLKWQGSRNAQDPVCPVRMLGFPALKARGLIPLAYGEGPPGLDLGLQPCLRVTQAAAVMRGPGTVYGPEAAPVSRGFELREPSRHWPEAMDFAAWTKRFRNTVSCPFK